MTERIQWSHKSLEDLRWFYREHIRPDLRRQLGHDPDTRPTYEQLTEVGYSGLDHTLRTRHDTTLREFFADVVGIDEGDAERPVVDAAAPTVEAVESYLRSLETRGQMADSTVETRQARLARYIHTYRRLHDRDDLLADLGDADARVEEIERALAVLDVFDEDLSTDRSKLEYLRVARMWYDFLVRRGLAEYNPLEGATEEFAWDREEPDNRALSAEYVRATYQQADDVADRLLVVALGGWGLRPSEVAALHASQLELDGDDPHLDFGEGERKNGPGTVALLVGLDELTERLGDLTEREDWTGYLFPSTQAAAGHITTATVRRRFKRLADGSGVRVAGDVPVPKMARRFWYSAYQDAVSGLLGQLEGIAEEQGSASAEVVMSNYLSEQQRRQQRRDAMRETLNKVFEE